MLPNKLKAVAVLLASITFARAAEEAPPPRAVAAKKVLTVIPVLVADCEGVAQALRELYTPRTDDREGVATALMRAHTHRARVTVVAVPAEHVLLVYADEATTQEIAALVQKLGRRFACQASVVPVPGLDSADTAAKLRKLFPDPKAGGPLIIPVPDEGVLLVYATEAQAREISLLVQHCCERRKPTPEPKKYTFEMRAVSWADVFEWYSKESGLAEIATTGPKGTFTFVAPPGAKYTLAEITDIINEVLTTQKFILIRREVTFLLHPADEKIDPTLIPRVGLADLAARGKTELVEVLLDYPRGHDAKESADEIRKMLSPFGTVTVVRGRLLMMDTAGNLRRIHETIQPPGEREPNTPKPTGRQPAGEPEIRKYPVPPGTAEAVARALTNELPLIRVVALPGSNEILVFATAEEHIAILKQIKGRAETEDKKPTEKPKTMPFRLKDGP